MKPFRFIITAVFLFWASFATWASPVHHGKVIHISDGDTLKIPVDWKQLKIRLAEIDTTERR